MKRTPLKRGKRLNPVSKKRSKQNAVYSVVRKEHLAKFPKCQVCCMTQANQIHHRKGRWGERLNNTEFFLAVCSACHEKIHSDPAWAYSEGFLLGR